jgi:circadian clock protein KaiC
MLRYFEADGVVRRAVSVVKKRTGNHETAIREFQLAAGGAVVRPPLKQFRGYIHGHADLYWRDKATHVCPPDVKS